MKTRNLSAARLSLPLASAIAALLAAPSAQAAAGPDTWVGNTSANFSSSDWTGTNNPPVTGDSWIFGAAGTSGTTLNNDLAAALTVAGITFNSGASAFTIAGNQITLTGDVTNNSTSLQTLNTAIATTAVRTLTLTSGGGNLTLGGVVSGTAGGITTAGSGTLTLSSANTYTGGTTINAGTAIHLKNPAALGTGGLTINGGTLQAGNASDTMTNQFTIGVGGGVIDTGSNTLTLTGSANAIFAGSGAFTKIGSGTLTVGTTSTVSTNTGGVFIKQGKLIYAAAGTNNALGTNANVITLGDTAITQNAELDFYNFGGNNRNIPNPITTVASATNGRLIISSGGSSGNNYGWSLTGAVTLKSNLYLQDGNTGGGGTSGWTGTTHFVCWAMTGNIAGTGDLHLQNTANVQAASLWLGNYRGVSETMSINNVGYIYNDSSVASPAATQFNTISANIGTNVSGVVQNGTVPLVLGGTNTFSGGVQLLSGELDIDLQNAALGTGTFQIGNSTGTTAVTIDSLSVRSVTNALNIYQDFTFKGTANLTQGTGAITLYKTPTITVPANTLTLDGVIDDGVNTYGLTKAGNGKLILSGANLYNGTTTVNAGVLSFAKQQALYNSTTASWTKANITVAAGATLELGVGDSASGYFDAAAIGTFLDASHMGASTATTGFKSGSIFGFDTTNATGGAFTYASPITNLSATSLTDGFAKIGTGTLTLSGLSATATNNYTGTTIIDQGTLAITTTNPTFTGGLQLGTALGSNVGSLDLTNASATFTGNLTVQTKTASVNTITIGSGNTLTVGGDLNMGYGANPVSGGSITNLTVSGAGSLVFNKSGGKFQVGAQNGGTNMGDNGTVLDASGLGILSVDMGGTGSVIVGCAGTGSTANPETLKLAATSTLKAGTISIADSSTSAGALMSLYLGSGTQTIQANAINMGTGARPNSQFLFNGGTGTVAISGYAGGASTANLNMGSNASSTGGATASAFDVSGHTATIQLGDLKMASRIYIGTQTETDTFKFDTGTLTVANQAVLANNTGTTTATSNTANMTLGGGSVGAGSATFTAGLSLGQNASTGIPASGTPTATGTLTINDNIGYAFNVTSGAITMATTAGTTSASNKAAANLNLNGGTLAMTGDIVAGGTGTGTAASTVTLNGGTLDLGNHNLGTAGNLIGTLKFQSGTLKNVSQINNGAALIKTSAGTLTLDGANTYTGDTNVSAGTLQLAATGSLTFKPTGASASNKITGAATAQLNGTLKLDLSAAAIATGNSWTIVDVASPTYSLTGVTSTSPTLTFSNSSGVWTAVDGNNTWTFTQSTGALTLAVASPGGFTNWIDTNYPSLSDKTPGGDPDQDGIKNLMEYVLNSNPGASSTASLPALTSDPTHFIFAYNRRVESASDTTQTFEATADMSFTDKTPVTIPGATPGTYGVVTVGSPTGTSPDQVQTITITIPKNADSKLFGRLKVTQP